jgi:hypothetical protein
MYPAPQTACVSAHNLNQYTADGDLLQCHINAVAGVEKDCDGPALRYRLGAHRRAYYECTGSTTLYTCFYKGTEMAATDVLV